MFERRRNEKSLSSAALISGFWRRIPLSGLTHRSAEGADGRAGVHWPSRRKTREVSSFGREEHVTRRVSQEEQARGTIMSV